MKETEEEKVRKKNADDSDTETSPRKAILTHPEWTHYSLLRCELRKRGEMN